MTTPPLDRFRREYQEYHRLSEGRIIEQQHCLRELEAHAEKPIIDCDADDIRDFLAGLTKKGLHPNTVQNRLHMIRPFFRWAWQAKLVPPERLMEVRDVSPPRGAHSTLPRPYSKKELIKFRKQLAAKYPTATPTRWTRWRQGRAKYSRIKAHAILIQTEAVVALALHCGLRAQEIYLASEDDIHFDNDYVVVRYAKDHESNGNGNHREVPHTAHSREKVKAWLELRAELAPKHDKLWLDLRYEKTSREPMSRRAFTNILGLVGSGWELHRLRHTYGTEMLRSTGRLEIVQRLLGHSRINQTLGYAELVRDDLQRAVEKAEADFMEAVA